LPVQGRKGFVVKLQEALCSIEKRRRLRLKSGHGVNYLQSARALCGRACKQSELLQGQEQQESRGL
jgi:hypothetical protein